MFSIAQEAFTVSKSGSGSGSITSSPAGLTCAATCSGTFPYGKPAMLTAVPDAGATFLQWTGACLGQGVTCTLTPKDTVTTNAVFGLVSGSTATTATTSTVTVTTTTGATTTRHIDSQLVAARVVRSKLGGRVLAIELSDNLPATVAITLKRSTTVIAAHRFVGASAGDGVLVVAIPAKYAAGSAQVAVAVTGPDGSTQHLSKSVRLPNP